MRIALGSITCLRKPAKFPGPGAAGVDAGRDTALSRANISAIDAERRAAPVDVGMQVDEAGRDETARDVARVGAARVEPVADRRDLAVVGKSHVRDPIDPLRGVDDARRCGARGQKGI